MPPDDGPSEIIDPLAGDVPEPNRPGLADWFWVPLLTAAILAALGVIGHTTFVA